jgi:hypothetical protein
MKLFLSLVAVAAAVLAPTATVAASHAKLGLRRTLDSTVAPAINKSSNSASNEICLPGGDEPLSKAKAALLQKLASLVVNSHHKDVADSERRPFRDPPKYVFGCAFLDIGCYECDLCQDVYGLLLETGSQVACDAACVVIVDAAGAGAGPEDRTCTASCARSGVDPGSFYRAISLSPFTLRSFSYFSTAIADAVAGECVPLCEDIFSAVGEGTALSTCTLVGLC